MPRRHPSGKHALDANRDLRLSDLDRGMKMGEDIAVLSEPFGRLLDQEDGVGAGTHGKSGAWTDLFDRPCLLHTPTWSRAL